MKAPGSVLVVGASAAGLTTAETLRRLGYPGELTVVGAERHPPYDRPPLSKQVLSGHWEPERATLPRPRESQARLEAEIILGSPAVALDTATRSVRTAAGRTLRADAVVIATGLSPLLLPGRADLAGAHVLRTLDDALALRAELTPGTRLVVVGDGVLGTEIAATASAMGVNVTLVGPQPAPMTAQLGPLVAEKPARLHTHHGVRLLPGTGVRGLRAAGGRVTGVLLGSGETLSAEVAVVAIGATPNTAWLAGSGLRVDNGLVCDSRCRAADGIYAAGDVARRHHDALGTLQRLENRTNATEQAMAVARTILGDDRPYRPIPYVWTDQFTTRIQVYGAPSADAELTVTDGDMTEDRFVALYHRGGAVIGVLGWNMPKQARLRRQRLVDAHAASTAP
ncbi:NAD(P)/FAD-dependent oxidoreductase [Streptomyces sp. NBC_01237]|uniref:NAD(P)/FAD-dependent oxidoreductase n=1 Tax=Streptomyces sp. NBC_01237 TaxID=2903790 RepID=UPI002DD91A0B|nr:FAD-dependent oxidoreductase [Streptomyces sp. NBC_01237]WRZ75647.1 FAD-dependent oxidoreductase [Streptomyces sp. NBC_01237]